MEALTPVIPGLCTDLLPRRLWTAMALQRIPERYPSPIPIRHQYKHLDRMSI
ncbi:uncharacterized protein PHACADRAFT_261019 [Phanerochaete carnosa HHB-10118-sp]|uniref:Uncharacterized protein n=1 Tax=Phanerochaete carnosa (strain HHB-10118-sp) TaxID=650164 RepID=K5VM62_PHACS|nr:uncharacterized protein PHACADRAFT_261019 [Phanerochaete carnosa HHB-10118-sp]EKM52533.1 hypothetical protein PHACADRAFT_261019 [Phanerochaete carnosa HHB-10118-sp]